MLLYIHELLIHMIIFSFDVRIFNTIFFRFK